MRASVPFCSLQILVVAGGSGLNPDDGSRCAMFCRSLVSLVLNP